MLDFVSVKTQATKRGTVEFYPEFKAINSKDLMIRGRAFYAIWDEEKGLWSRSENDAIRLIDEQVISYAKEHDVDGKERLQLLVNFSSKKLTEFQQYCKALSDNYHDLDSKIIFANTKTKKKDYVSRCLPYALEEGECPAYEELISTLYDEDERRKIEWTIGAIMTGDSKKIQKFLVFYGDPGSGKSTILHIMEQLFGEYQSPFDSKTLGMKSNAFALEMFRTNPLVAIQHEGDLSQLEDNARINSIVSHETMLVNEKFKTPYSLQFKTFMILATNKPVRITDAKSGILRRLIDVNPSGRKLPRKRYDLLMDQIEFELGHIADHCIKVYRDLGRTYYDAYIPFTMMGATNDFYNFVEENYFWFNEHPEGVTLNECWLRYKEYCTDANIPYPYKKMIFKSELKNYFDEFKEHTDAGWNVYQGFRKEKLNYKIEEEPEKLSFETWLHFDCEESLLDKELADCVAQYATPDDIPSKKWSRVGTRLSDLDTKKLHYVKVPENLIVIDFDKKNEKGEKDYRLNLEAATKWPRTYAELSKSGTGIHLHYIYKGDVNKLSRIYDEDIEVKVFTGDSSLRRCVSKCNDIPIAEISSGLPLVREKKVIKEKQIKSERALRQLIKKCLRKENHGHTKPEIDFIKHILDEAYESGLKYDVSDLRPSVQTFAIESRHQPGYCLKMVGLMPFQSEEPSDNVEEYSEDMLIFFDVEVFPNLFIIVWKKQGPNQKYVKMINPTPAEVEELTKFKLIGFNNRRYDNHILYARMMGYTEQQLYDLSQRIINDNDRNALFGEAYNLSYTDIYDFLSAGNKMSLKKWEIKLGIHHQELGLPWDQPVPRELWEKVADYCTNDVMATEAVWDANEADWKAREILADLSDLTVNDTTNRCTTKFIVGNDRNPQSQYIYTDLSTIFPGYRFNPYGIPKEEYTPGTKIVSGKSIYRGEDPGEGGYVYADPGMYRGVVVLDVASMHPHSLIRLKLFGEYYTMRFKEIVDARIYIKRGDFDKARTILDGKLAKYLDDPTQADNLANALKTAINSVYGLTSAKFDNKLKDPRNKDNIVAKYGALFMINLKHEVQERGYKVIHIKTDSIKIAEADNEIIQFVMEYGEKYGYTFEHESTYQKICLVNDAVYIARYETAEKCQAKYGYIPKNNQKHSYEWTATGAQFQVPYVFKTLFSKEPIIFADLCETKSVSTAIYLDMAPDTEIHDYRFVGKVGQFCPIKPGHGGGVLLRQGDNGKFGAVTGTKKQGKVPKGEPDIYYWLESETVKTLGIEDSIDRSYYNAMVNEAVVTISKYGDFERFVSDDSSLECSWMNIPETDEDELPFDNLDKEAT